MDPNQENVRKKLLSLILANYKKIKKKKKICERRRKRKQKNQFIQKKNPIPILIFDYWDQFDTITKKTAFLNLLNHPSVLAEFSQILAELG